MQCPGLMVSFTPRMHSGSVCMGSGDAEILHHLQVTRVPNTKQWIFVMIETLPHASLIKLVVTLWAIWTARRKLIHEGVTQSPHATYSFVHTFISESDLVKAPCRNQVISIARGHVHSGRRKAWIRPPLGAAKIQVDGGL